MKKKILTTILLITPLLLCGSLQAGMTERVEKLEEEMAQIGTINSMDNFGTSFTTASPKGENGLYIFVDPLYWHAKVGGTEFAFTVEIPQQTLDPEFIGNPPQKGGVKANSFNWDWGLRVGLGTHLGSDNWDINANYTWFETNQTATVQKNAPAFVRATRINEIIWMKRAKSSYSVGYNNVNLELGRSYFISENVSTKPYLGLKSAWIDLDQNIHYTLTFLDGPNAAEGRIVKVIGKSFLWGMGPRGGVNMEWYLGDGFSIAGNLAGALIYGYARGSEHFKPDGNIIQGVSIERRIKSKTHRFIPTAQMFLGLIWETFMFEKTKHLTLGAGYEVEYYWRANQMTNMEDTSTPNIFIGARRDQVQNISEDVMFYGITLKARLDF